MKGAQPLFGDTSPALAFPGPWHRCDTRGEPSGTRPPRRAASLPPFFHGKGNESRLRQAEKKKKKAEIGKFRSWLGGRGRVGAGLWRSPSPGNAWEPGKAAGSRSAAWFPAFFFFPLLAAEAEPAPNPCRALPTSQQGAPSDLKTSPARRGERVG